MISKLRFLGSDVADVEADVDAVEADVAAHETRLDALESPIGVEVALTAVEATATSTQKIIPWDVEVRDDGGFWVVGSPSKLTVPAGLAGWYDISAGLSYTSNATGNRDCRLFLNGTTYISIARQVANPSTDSRIYANRIIYLAEAAFVEVEAFQSSGSAIDIQTTAGGTFFSMSRING